MKTLPLSDEQKYIFEFNENGEGIKYNVSFEMRFRKEFSTDELRFAIRKCLLAADISGARCISINDLDCLEFSPPRDPEIPEFNFPTDAEYQEFCDTISNTKVNNHDKLYYVFIYSIGNSTKNIRFMFNHIIFDGISGVLLQHKIQKILIDKNEEVHWHPYSNYLEKIARYRTSERYLSDRTFWEGRFRELSSCGNIFPETIEITESPTKDIKIQTGQALKENLSTYCNLKKLSPHLLIATVFSKLLSDRYGCMRFYLEIPLGNRVGHNEKNSIGAYEIAHPFIFDFEKYENLDDALTSVIKQSKDYYKHKDFDWIEHVGSDHYERTYGSYIPQVLFSYFCLNKDYSSSISTAHHFHGKSSTLPITLYVSDYHDLNTYSFYYVFWGCHFTLSEIIDIHNDLEARLRKIIEKGLACVSA